MDVDIAPNISFESESNTSEAQEVKLSIINERNNFTNMGGKTFHTT